MKSDWWSNILRQHDISIVLMFVLVLSFLLNYEMNDDERIKRIMSIVALTSCLIVVAVEALR
jgi:hypothetical protein